MIYKLFPNQISAGKEIIDAYINGKRWCTLGAQMQSGKTDTYLFACCEAIRLGIVDSAIIFSGTADTDLKKQLKKQLKAMLKKKYTRYLIDYVDDINEEKIKDTKKFIKEKIKIVWGTELNGYIKKDEKTLFVWEESHYAQSIKQRPDKFLKKNGISADGDNDILEENNVLVLSVSATPFAEWSDMHHLSQDKVYVNLIPGDNYNSVKNVCESGRLKSVSVLEDGLREALATPHDSPKYGIIRISKKNEEKVVEAIKRNGTWKIVYYDSVSDKKTIKKGKKIWKKMKKAPEKDTIILIKNKCRMGKNLKKKHVIFVMETSRNSKTDTILQGLLGRTCGYDEGSDQVDVYLHEKIIKSGEIERYIGFTKNNEEPKEMPLKARNLNKGNKSKTTEPIIPIMIERRLSANDDPKTIKQDVFKALTEDSARIKNKNSQEILEEVTEKYIRNYNDNNQNIQAGYLDINKKTRTEKLANKLFAAYESGIAKRFGSGAGIDTKAMEIKIWVPKNIPGFDDRFVYVTAYVKKNTDDCNIPHTTKAEVFAHKLEDNTTIVCNGGILFPLRCETADGIDEMCEDIEELIGYANNRESKGAICNRKITSCFDYDEKEFKGILVMPYVYEALGPGGSIAKKIKERFGYELKLERTRGQLSKEIKEKGYLKLASISW